jgi:hypothetical protein
MQVMEFARGSGSALAVSFASPSADAFAGEARQLKAALLDWRAKHGPRCEMVMLTVTAAPEHHPAIEALIGRIHRQEAELAPLFQSVSVRVALLNQQGKPVKEYTLGKQASAVATAPSQTLAAAPMIRVTCKCGASGKVPASYAGKQVKCRKCAGMIPVPADEEPVPIEIESEPPGEVNLFGFEVDGAADTTARWNQSAQPGFPWIQTVLALLAMFAFTVRQLLKTHNPALTLGLGAIASAIIIGMSCLIYWWRTRSYDASVKAGVPPSSGSGTTIGLVFAMVGLVVLLILGGIGLVSHLDSTGPSDNKGIIEGTRWSHRGGRYGGIEIPRGGLTMDFSTDGRITVAVLHNQINGTYTLGSGKRVTFHLDEAVSGRKEHQQKITIDGDELTMDDSDGTRHVFSRVPDDRIVSGLPEKKNPLPKDQAKNLPPEPVPQRTPAYLFTGKWQGTVEGFKEVWTIKANGNSVSVSAVYLRNDKEVGSFTGEDVDIANNVLTFTQKFDKVPEDAGWPNNAEHAVVRDGGKLSYTWKLGGLSGTRTLERFKETVAQRPPDEPRPEPKPKPEPKPVEEKQLPVPMDAALAAAEKTIKDLFKDDYAKTKPADRLALAQKLLEQARETRDDPAARYVLFREAIDLAAQGGDLNLALAAVGDQSRCFVVNSAAVKRAAIDKVAAGVSATDAKALVDLLLPILDDALSADDYETAARVATAAEAAAKKSKNLALVAQIRNRAKDIDAGKASFEKVQTALKALQAKPDDADASLLVGRHYCLVRGDWDKGLPCLVKGSDAALKALAQKDLAGPANAAEQLALADGWYDLAAKESPKAQLQLRALYWYQQALPGLTGLAKTKAEKRLGELDKVAATQGGGIGLYADIRKQIGDKKLKRWDFVGGGFAKESFEEVPADGAILIGFRYSTGSDGKPLVAQPIWQTSRGAVNGKQHGTPEAGGQLMETRAKPGYAVGAIYVRGGAYIAAFKPIYMKITDKGLDPKDSYEGPHIGITKGGGQGTLGGDGKFIVGLHGKVTDRKLGTLSPVSLMGAVK